MEQGNKGTSLKMKGTGDQRQFWGIKKLNPYLILGEQGKILTNLSKEQMVLFQWEGLVYAGYQSDFSVTLIFINLVKSMSFNVHIAVS